METAPALGGRWPFAGVPGGVSHRPGPGQKVHRSGPNTDQHAARWALAVDGAAAVPDRAGHRSEPCGEAETGG